MHKRKRKKELVAYKLLRKRRNGTLGPLFINRGQVIESNEWLKAENHPTKGFAERPGWHCTLKPVAPHLKMNLKSGEKRVWCKVLVRGAERFNRPESQGGTWVLANGMKLFAECRSGIKKC